MQEKVVFTLEMLDERIKRKAMKLVCDFPGVTSVDVKEHGTLKVTGEFDTHGMTEKLMKKICAHVVITALGPDGESEQNQNPVTRPTASYPRPSLAENFFQFIRLLNESI